MGELDGQVAVVTGAAGAGIGQACARRLAADGAAVAVTDVHARRTQEVTEALQKELGAATQPAATHPAHFQVPESDMSIQQTAGLEPRRDGNNVELDRELLKMTEASGEFARAQTALAAKFRLVRYAISEGQR